MSDESPRLASPPAMEPTKRRPRLDLGGGEKKRGRSMFGMLLGTLNKAKSEDKERNASEAAKKRHLIEQRLQAKLRKENETVRRAEEAKKDKLVAVRKEEELCLKDSVVWVWVGLVDPDLEDEVSLLRSSSSRCSFCKSDCPAMRAPFCTSPRAVWLYHLRLRLVEMLFHFVMFFFFISLTREERSGVLLRASFYSILLPIRMFYIRPQEEDRNLVSSSSDGRSASLLRSSAFLFFSVLLSFVVLPLWYLPFYLLGPWPWRVRWCTLSAREREGLVHFEVTRVEVEA
ncbi:hypothetical protein BDQ17DRAFT_279213 [Cyathus striatus]|nr:hypothetical protein BDQ17DRAFT_279213 [Cyathus striatus]